MYDRRMMLIVSIIVSRRKGHTTDNYDILNCRHCLCVYVADLVMYVIKCEEVWMKGMLGCLCLAYIQISSI